MYPNIHSGILGTSPVSLRYEAMHSSALPAKTVKSSAVATGEWKTVASWALPQYTFGLSPRIPLTSSLCSPAASSTMTEAVGGSQELVKSITGSPSMARYCFLDMVWPTSRRIEYIPSSGSWRVSSNWVLKRISRLLPRVPVTLNILPSASVCICFISTQLGKGLNSVRP